MRPKIMLISCAILLGCAGPEISSLNTPSVPEIYGYVGSIQHLSGAELHTGADLVTAAYVIVDDRCQKFFNALENEKSRLLFEKNSVVDATSTTIQIMSLLKDLQREIGIVAAVGKFVSDRLDDYGRLFYYAPYSGQLYKLVTQAQADYKNTMVGAVDALSNQPLQNAKVLNQATNIAQGYGRTCTVSQFQLFVETALNKSNAKPADPAKPSDGAGGTTFNQFRYPPSQRSSYSNRNVVYLPPYTAQ